MKWEFVETWKGLSNQPVMVAYEVRLLFVDGEPRAEIDIDGHMVLCRVLASVLGTEKGLKFFFLRNREEHVLPIFKPGDLLFEIRKERGRILTHWASLQPTFDENCKPGSYFKPAK
ncbi:DUF5991 domain-containing protein [Mesoterricola silvestris]|uniref:DUF5991 domain-containing protein n=1 Tax=Mesoterricola silvestris TaxID=2927979 RepID=UPI00374225E1